jgi:FixJ family two-component response regulator
VIVVLDDNDSVRKAMVRLLNAAGFASRGVASGQEFLKSWLASQPDCLILDLLMPGIAATEIQRAVRLTGSRTAVIIITAYDAPGRREECMGGGAVDYLCKPLAARSLLDAVARVVGSRNDESKSDGELTH